MPRLWIVHRDPQLRAALARLAGAPHDAVAGAPGDPVFQGAEPAEVVLLGLAGDLEAELEFAHREAPRLPQAAWLLIGEHAQLEAARGLFDRLEVEWLAYPPEGAALRRRVRALARRAGATPLALSQRAAREELAARFARWFGDLGPSLLLHALDPRLASVPALLRGEPGSGLGVLARYLHGFASSTGGAFLQAVCTPGLSPRGLREAIGDAGRHLAAGSQATLCLIGVDRLDAATARSLVDWIELGLPAAVLPARGLRWIGIAGPGAGEQDPLDASLRDALGGLTLEIPPLRERTSIIPGLLEAVAERFCRARGERTRRFDEAAVRLLCEYPWPGNLRELEAVVVQSLAASSSDPLQPDDLEYAGSAFAPHDAEAFGAVLVDAAELLDTPEPPPAPAGAAPPPAVPAMPGAPAAQDAPASPLADPLLRRISDVLAHEVRNPLTAIRTFSELLPERWMDEEFRARFAERTGEGVRRIEAALDQLSRVMGFGPAASEAVDVSRLLAELLEAHRDAIRERRLLVLQELDSQQPLAQADPEQLRFALDALLGACFGLVPERGDVYLASKHHPAGLRGRPALRVLARFHGPERGTGAARFPGLSPAENSLGLLLAERVVRAQQGAFAVNAGEGGETLVVLDLPAPA